MADPQTANIGLAIPTRGTDVGTWDTPVNNNMTLLDLVVGGNATIGLNNANVVLAAAQFEAQEITFNSTLTGSVTITFPSTFVKSYAIQHLCTGSSAFTITLATTVAGGQAICAAPGEIIDVINDGTNLKYRNLGRIGGYWDYAGSSVPSWVSGCTVAPYLNCDGTTFSSATYPILSLSLGSTTLPDLRGRTRAYLNQGTGRMTTANGGVDGNTISASGGADTVTLATSQIPAHSHPIAGGINPTGSTTLVFNYAGTTSGTTLTSCSAGGGGPHSIMQPTAVGGLTLIRAA